MMEVVGMEEVDLGLKIEDWGLKIEDCGLEEVGEGSGGGWFAGEDGGEGGGAGRGDGEVDDAAVIGIRPAGGVAEGDEPIGDAGDGGGGDAEMFFEIAEGAGFPRLKEKQCARGGGAELGFKGGLETGVEGGGGHGGESEKCQVISDQ